MKNIRFFGCVVVLTLSLSFANASIVPTLKPEAEIILDTRASPDTPTIYGAGERGSVLVFKYESTLYVIIERNGQTPITLTFPVVAPDTVAQGGDSE